MGLAALRVGLQYAGVGSTAAHGGLRGADHAVFRAWHPALDAGPGFAANWIRGLQSHRLFRKVTGGLLILFGLWTLPFLHLAGH